MKQASLIVSILIAFIMTTRADEKLSLKSPDGAIQVSINIGEFITYSVSYHNDLLFSNN